MQKGLGVLCPIWRNEFRIPRDRAVPVSLDCSQAPWPGRCVPPSSNFPNPGTLIVEKLAWDYQLSGPRNSRGPRRDDSEFSKDSKLCRDHHALIAPRRSSTVRVYLSKGGIEI